MSLSPPREPIESIRRSPAARTVAFTGRVVSVLDGALLVQDGSGTVWVDPSTKTDVPLGAWIALTGTWDGSRVRHVLVTTENAPTGPFPAPAGDWRWFTEQGGRRTLNVRARARMMHAVRSYFDGQDFVEVETPLAVPSPGLDTHLAAFGVEGTRSLRWLITSPEYQMKRLLAGGMPRIYQTCRCFRRDEAGALHQPEFSMLEWYRGNAGAEDVMTDTERLVSHVAQQLRRDAREPLVVDGRNGPIDLSPPWPRMRITEAFQQYAGVDASTLLSDESLFFQVYAEQVEPHLGREKPIFLTHWPASMASLARLFDDDPQHAERFEVIVDGVELCNGFGELIDADEQERRLRQDQRTRQGLGLPVYPLDERFLDALREGLPPSGGNALGLDRLLMLLLGERHIDDVCAIPHDRL